MPLPSIFRKPSPVDNPQPASAKPAPACAIQSMSAETGLKLRLLLRDDFTAANSWGDLSNRLLEKGFYIRTQDGEILIHDCISHLKICSSQFIGCPSNVLEDRFDQAHLQKAS